VHVTHFGILSEYGGTSLNKTIFISEICTVNLDPTIEGVAFQVPYREPSGADILPMDFHIQ
jgi:hypothetical protein